MYYLHDTHLHLDLYNKQIPEIIEEIEENRIFTIVVTNLPVLFEKLKTKTNSKYIHLALGFHPELVFEYKKYIDKMWAYLNETIYIGEVGLNLKDVTPNDYHLQIHFFKKLLGLCDSLGNKVLSVHAKGSENEILNMLPNNFNGKIIHHWYSGSLKNLDIAVNKGGYFSVNYQMLNSKKGQMIVNRIPEDRLLLESDGPFIKINNRVFRPVDLETVASKLSSLKNIEKNRLMEILARNLNTLLNM